MNEICHKRLFLTLEHLYILTTIYFLTSHGNWCWRIAGLLSESLSSVISQGDYNGHPNWQQNGGRKATLKNTPHLSSEEIMTDHFCCMYL